MTRTIFEIKSPCHLSMSMYIIHIAGLLLSKSKWVCGALLTYCLNSIYNHPNCIFKSLV